MTDRQVPGFEKAMFGEGRVAPFDANHIEHGLTKRELFAAMAMQGLLAYDRPNFDVHQSAKDAVIFADALIAELCK